MKLLPSKMRRIPGLGGAGGGGGGPTLGIAVGDRAWTIAEVTPSRAQRGSWELRRIAEFVPPAPVAGATAADPAATGQALAQFLREHSFSARGAVLGVPAKWIIGRDKEVPPSTPEQAAEILRLQADRSFSSDVGDLAYDYAGNTDASATTTVLLLALRRSQLDHVVAVAEAAGRDIVAVTPSTLALSDVAAGRNAPLGAAQPTSAAASDGLVVSVTPDAVELSARAGGNPRLLRHLSVRAPDLASKNGTRSAAFAALAGEIRRTMAMLPGGNVAGGSSARALQLFDGAGLGDSDGLSEQLGFEVKYRHGVSALRVTGAAAAASAGAEAARYAPAVALALAGAERRAELVDFLHPRLAPPKESRLGRREQWAILIAVVVVVLAVLFWFDLRSKGRELATLSRQRDDLSKSVETFQRVIDQVQAASPWFDQRTPTLECFRELTDAFPDTDPIYVTSFTLTGPDTPTAPAKVRVGGRAPYDAAALAVRTRLQANPKFSSVSVETRSGAGNSREVIFTLTCNYNEKPLTADQRNATRPSTPGAAVKPREVRK